MVGVLDWVQNPANQGLLSLAAGLMQAGGPQRMPTSFGQALGQGANAGMDRYNSVQGQQLQRQLTDAQIKQLLFSQQMEKSALGMGDATPPTGVLASGGAPSGALAAPPAAPSGGYGSPPPQPMGQSPQPQASGNDGPNKDWLRASVINKYFPGYATLYGAANSPTDLQKTIAAINNPNTPPEVKAELQKNLQKQNYIAPIGGTRPGVPIRDPMNPGQIISENPSIPPNTNVTRNPDGSVASVTPQPGANEAVAAQAAATTAATEGVKSQFDLVPGMTDNSGRPVYRPKSSVLPQQGAAGVTSGTPVITAPDEKTAQEWMKTFESKGVPVNIKVAAESALKAPGRIPTSAVIGQSTGEKAAQEENEKILAAEGGKLRESANLAVDTNYNLQNMLKAANTLPTGKYTDFRMGVKASLQGILPDSMTSEKDLSNITDYQEFKKYSIKLGFDQARKMGARESTQIVEMSISSNPNPELVKPAIVALGHGLIAQNDYVIAKAKAQDQWQKANNGTLQGFNSDWQSKADPRAFAVKYMTPAEQAKAFGQMSVTDKKTILNSLTQLRASGAL